MRHYEIVIMIHPDQGEQLSGMMDRYKTMIADAGGVVHRYEEWGRRQLAYSIDKLRKAYYVLFNIECEPKLIAELENAFKYNDAVIRSLTVKMTHAVTEPSPMMKEDKREGRSRDGRGRRDRRGRRGEGRGDSDAKVEGGEGEAKPESAAEEPAKASDEGQA